MPLKIATWNINSVRLRIGLVEQFLRQHKPEILCLQETKTPDEFFPYENFEKLGYRHRVINGMKGYNGVAIVSRVPFASFLTHNRCGKEDCRHIAASIDTGDGDPIELHNIYVPAGGDIPDPDQNVKFRHKLDFMTEIGDWFEACKPGKGQRKGKKRIIVGDLNIAPLEHDVWSHKQLLSVVSHTPVEVELFERLMKTQDWIDLPRLFVPADQKLYSWWSYRNRDWRLSDRGRRLDHVLVSPALKDSIKSHAILKDARDWERGSDHVPVLATLNV